LKSGESTRTATAGLRRAVSDAADSRKLPHDLDQTHVRELVDVRDRVQTGRDEAIPSHPESLHVGMDIIEFQEHIAGMDISRYLTGDDQHATLSPHISPGFYYGRRIAVSRRDRHKSCSSM